MFGRLIVFVIGLGLAIGFLVPSGPQPAENVQPAPRPRKPNVISVPSAPPGIILERSANGHFHADVEVNGRTIRFLVDTGASAIALSAEDARKLGFNWSDQELTTVGRGVSGPVSGKMVRLHHIKLGEKEAWDMEAAIIPAGLEVSLLGQSFLSQIGTVSMDGNRMTLH